MTVDYNNWKDYKCIKTYHKNTKAIKVLSVLTKEIYILLMDCINGSISNGQFPTEFKMADVIPIFKIGQSYRPISLLPSLLKVFKKIVYQQLKSFFEKKLSFFLCGFCSRYGMQHAHLNLINKMAKLLGLICRFNSNRSLRRIWLFTLWVYSGKTICLWN